MSRLRDEARFGVWVRLLAARLRRRGCALEVSGAAPRLGGLPRVELAGGGRGGRVALSFAPGASLGHGAVLELHPGTESALALGTGAYLQPAVRLELRGGRIALGPRAHARSFSVLKAGPGAEILVGEDVTISYGCVVAAAESVRIGARCGIGERVTLQDSDHAATGTDAWYLREPLRCAPIVLGRNVWIGANAVLLRGTRVGDNAIVGAGSVVRGGDHPPGALLAGAPATVRRGVAPDDR